MDTSKIKDKVRETLTDDEKEIYDDLLQKSKEHYPGLVDEIYSLTIHYYIKSGLKDDCFHKLEKENKKSIDKVEKEEKDEHNEIL